MAVTASRQLARRLAELGRISDERGRLTRTFLSPAMRRANARIAAWMRAAGLSVREDAVGNVIGRLEGAKPNAKTLVLGSHLDTVRDAGRFDGALGVLLPIAALGELRRRRRALPFAVEVAGFSEEEGVRFSSAYLGSKGYTGQLRAADLKRRDAAGVSVREAMQRWSALSSTRLASNGKRAGDHALHRGQLLGYLEVHIEQGPVLEREKLAVGVVSAIAGQTRVRITFRGEAGHAGTTPMALRRDALTGAAEFIVATEGVARASAPLVATVGTLEIASAAPNVIPGKVALSLDVRHPHDGSRAAALKLLRTAAKKISRMRGLTFEWIVTQENGAVACSPRLRAKLERSVRAVQRRTLSLVSGAGHDAVTMSTVTDVAMLFVRCRGGLSHHPDEYASPADIDVALAVVVDFLQRLGESSHEK